MTEAAVDWKVTNYDPFTCSKPSVETELERLKVLKSYGLLDRRGEECYHNVVRTAAEIFRLPAIISLVDLERCWTVASSNPDLTKKGRRKNFFCSHTILTKQKTLLVPDASKDQRFKDLPFVVDKPLVKFYVGAPLRSPEGYMIGSLSLLSPEKREWTDKENDILVELSEIVVNLMETRRKILAKQAQMEECKSKQVAATTTTHSSSASGKRQFGAAVHRIDVPPRDASPSSGAYSNSQENNHPHPPTDVTATTPSHNIVGDVTSVHIAAFAKTLEDFMESVPRTVSLLFIVDPSLSAQPLWFHDLNVFCSAVSMVTSACQRTTNGQICLTLYQSPRSDNSLQLTFECEDTAPNIAFSETTMPMSPSSLDLPSGANETRPTEETTSRNDSIETSTTTTTNNNKNKNDFDMSLLRKFLSSVPGAQSGVRRRFPNTSDRTGNTAWFSLPLVTAAASIISASSSSSSMTHQQQTCGNNSSIIGNTLRATTLDSGNRNGTALQHLR